MNSTTSGVLVLNSSTIIYILENLTGSTLRIRIISDLWMNNTLILTIRNYSRIMIMTIDRLKSFVLISGAIIYQYPTINDMNYKGYVISRVLLYEDQIDSQQTSYSMEMREVRENFTIPYNQYAPVMYDGVRKSKLWFTNNNTSIQHDIRLKLVFDMFRIVDYYDNVNDSIFWMNGSLTVSEYLYSLPPTNIYFARTMNNRSLTNTSSTVSNCKKRFGDRCEGCDEGYGAQKDPSI